MCVASTPDAPKLKPAPPPQAPAAQIKVGSPYDSTDGQFNDASGLNTRRRQGFQSLRIERTGSLGTGV